MAFVLPFVIGGSLVGHSSFPESLGAFRDGRLTDALALQEAVARDRPADPAARLFLVELLTLAGRFRDAWDELDRVASDDPDWPAASRDFRRIIRCGWRREHSARPVLPADPPRHAARRWKAWRALARDDAEAAAEWTDRADAVTPHLLGHIDGREFDGLRDADDRFASVLEVFAGRDYVWVPWEHVRRLVVHPEKHPLDRAYRPARLRLADGPERDVLLPLVYPGSFSHGDGFALGLDTDRVGDGPVRCVGGKELLTGDEELPLGECRQIEIRAKY
jgi:type VI secretion system protein ImpE